MFIDIVPNRSSPPAVLLRESYRDENGRPQKRTLANLSKLPSGVIEALKVLLKGGKLGGTEPRELRSSGRCRMGTWRWFWARCASWRSTVCC
jgi:hypothetical protein